MGEQLCMSFFSAHAEMQEGENHLCFLWFAHGRHQFDAHAINPKKVQMSKTGRMNDHDGKIHGALLMSTFVLQTVCELTVTRKYCGNHVCVKNTKVFFKILSSSFSTISTNSEA